MANNKYKKKANKLTSIITGIVILVFGILFLLDKVGIVNYDSILTSLGLKDNTTIDGEVCVHFIDVGQGDSELIISGNKTVLIDAGEKEYGTKVTEYLKKYNITKIDYVIGTHPHSDHIGGLETVINNFEIGEIFMPKIKDDLVPTTTTYLNLLKAIKNKGLKISSGEFGQRINLSKSELILYPPQKDYDGLNNYSIVTKLIHGKNTFLLTGDAETIEEKDLINSSADLKADVYKAGHHGSSTSSSSAFLKKVKPQICVISVGEGNKYRHPSDVAIKRMSEYTENIYRTDLLGTIVIVSDEKGLHLTYEKEEK